jgi:hypothetical protein
VGEHGAAGRDPSGELHRPAGVFVHSKREEQGRPVQQPVPPVSRASRWDASAACGAQIAGMRHADTTNRSCLTSTRLQSRARSVGRHHGAIAPAISSSATASASVAGASGVSPARRSASSSRSTA